MCDNVIVHKGENAVLCTNHGELKDAIGGEPAYVNIGAPENEDCLCDLDAERTAELYDMATGYDGSYDRYFVLPSELESGIKSTA